MMMSSINYASWMEYVNVIKRENFILSIQFHFLVHLKNNSIHFVFNVLVKDYKICTYVQLLKKVSNHLIF